MLKSAEPLTKTTIALFKLPNNNYSVGAAALSAEAADLRTF
jgi:hypothetical protein